MEARQCWIKLLWLKAIGEATVHVATKLFFRAEIPSDQAIFLSSITFNYVCTRGFDVRIEGAS
jgi:hypothetical protein